MGKRNGVRPSILRFPVRRLGSRPEPNRDQRFSGLATPSIHGDVEVRNIPRNTLADSQLIFSARDICKTKPTFGVSLTSDNSLLLDPV